MAVRVRRLEAKDKRTWRTLFDGYIAFYKAAVGDDVIEITWDRLLSGAAGSPIGLVAVDDEEIPLGLAHLLFHRSTWSKSWYCYLEDLFVDPANRGRGIGRALIEAVYREADAQECTRTYWTTQEFNYQARYLYDQLAIKSPFIQYRR
jgi:GNAT superfamily N-acetyltransferase